MRKTSKQSHPSPLLALMEYRSFGELALHPLIYPFARCLPRGDGQPIMVIPGFMSGDRGTALIRLWINKLGYAAHGWQQGRNIGVREDIQVKLGQHLQALYERYNKPVRLIGWSLGGIQARALAHAFPELVNSVITLGSPFGLAGATNVGGPVAKLYNRMNPDNLGDLTNPNAEWRHSPPVPSSAVYSPFDGISGWRLCIDKHVDQQTENIRVLSSHTGMGSSPELMLLLAYRLLANKDAWQPMSLSQIRDMHRGRSQQNNL
jgi:pimeloyl-ACP methyl ester carboxylesterase